MSDLVVWIVSRNTKRGERRMRPVAIYIISGMDLLDPRYGNYLGCATPTLVQTTDPLRRNRHERLCTARS